MFSTTSKIQLVWMAFVVALALLVMLAVNYVLVKLWNTNELTLQFIPTPLEHVSVYDKLRDDR